MTAVFLMEGSHAVDKKTIAASAPVSRRDFGKRIALATGAAIVPSARIAGGAVAPGADGHAGHEAFDQNDPSLDRLSAEGRVRFDSMWQNVLRKHGDRLTDDQRVRMRKIIATNVTMLESVYAVPLRNGDAPATTLRLEEGKAAARRGGPASRQPATARPAPRKPAGARH